MQSNCMSICEPRLCTNCFISAFPVSQFGLLLPRRGSPSNITLIVAVMMINSTRWHTQAKLCRIRVGELAGRRCVGWRLLPTRDDNDEDDRFHSMAGTFNWAEEYSQGALEEEYLLAYECKW